MKISQLSTSLVALESKIASSPRVQRGAIIVGMTALLIAGIALVALRRGTFQSVSSQSLRQISQRFTAIAAVSFAVAIRCSFKAKALARATAAQAAAAQAAAAQAAAAQAAAAQAAAAQAAAAQAAAADAEAQAIAAQAAAQAEANQVAEGQAEAAAQAAAQAAILTDTAVGVVLPITPPQTPSLIDILKSNRSFPTFQEGTPPFETSKKVEEVPIVDRKHVKKSFLKRLRSFFSTRRKLEISANATEMRSMIDS